jgi:hypothetical protein
MDSSTVENKQYETIQYNEDLYLVRSIEDDMFQVQSIMLCLGYNQKKYDHINHYFNLKGTNELVDEIMNNLTLAKIGEVHETRNNIKKEYIGTYIHRLLINHFASWHSPEYSYKKQIILDNVFKAQMEELRTKNYGLTIHSQEIKKDNEEKRKELYAKSIRSDDCNKKLKLIKYDNIFVVSACQDKVGDKLFKEYIFPSAIAIRQLIKNKFKKECQTPKFKEDELAQLIEFIEELKPKIIN